MQRHITTKEMAKQLAGLPGSNDPSFPSKLGDVVSGASSDPDPTRAVLESLIGDSDIPMPQRFAAFYGLLTYVRRLKDLGHYTLIFDKYEHHFADEPMLLLLRSQKFLNDSSSPICRQSALDYAELAYEQLKDHYGVIQHLATCITTVQEYREYRKEPVRGELLRAQALVDRAQSLRGIPYPTYKANEARIASLLGDHDAALAAIDDAIEIEPSSAANYAVRIMDHQLVKARILIRRDFEAIRASAEEATRLTESVRAELLTLLGLLAAVVAFLVTGVNVAVVQPFDTAARLLVTVAGSIVVVFAAFSTLFVRHDRLSKLTIGAIGLVLIFFSAFAWPHL